MSVDDRSTLPPPNDPQQPEWRRPFPVDVQDETSRSRREFISGLSVAGGAMACGQAALNYVAPDSAPPQSAAKTFPPFTLDKKLNELAIGEAMLFHYPTKTSPCLLVKLACDEVVAFAQKCTHLACPVIPKVEESMFHCPCHHGSFDLRTGYPRSGPPRSALARIDVTCTSDGTLTATGISTPRKR